MNSTPDQVSYIHSAEFIQKIQSPSRAIVLFSGSDGSSWLCDMLGRQEGIFQPAFEPFCAEGSWEPTVRRELLKALLYGDVEAAKSSFPIAFPDDSSLVEDYGSSWRGAKAIFFKIRINELPPELTPELIKQLDVRIINLTRKNKLKQAISHVRRTTHNISHFDFNSIQPAVELSFAEIEGAAEHFTQQEKDKDRFLKRNGLLHLKVSYEEMLQDPTQQMIAIMEFMGIGASDIVPGSYFGKVTSDDFTSAVKDYDAFSHYFGKGKFARYLD